MIDVNFKDNIVYFLDIRKTQNGIETPGIIEKLNTEIEKILAEIFPINKEKSALLKVHIGEPLKKTHMKPELLKPIAGYLKQKGVNDVVYGDTTVAYSGERGYKENPESDVTKYLNLAKENGFTDIPFVVLDRPITKTMDLNFNKVHIETNVNDHRIRYKKIYPSGGYLAAKIIINNAHLTGHPLAKNAVCNKSISMGLSSYAGKLQLHQSLYPEINYEKCILCGECVEQCPVDALAIEKEKVEFTFNLCIGCGQCASICPENAVTMVSEGIETWNKGVDSIDIRMCEYTIAMLNEFKGRMLNIGHLYTVTSGCDCINKKETPNCKDIGIVIGFNPFAVDFTATSIETMLKKDNDTVTDVNELVDFAKTRPRFEMYDYVKDNFGIEYIPELKIIQVS